MGNSRGIGDAVEHPQFGRGVIAAIYRNGSEWLVRFDSGLRFRRPRREFVGQQELVLAPAVPLPVLDAQPMAPSQDQARQLVEALRVLNEAGPDGENGRSVTSLLSGLTRRAELRRGAPGWPGGPCC